MGTSNVDRIDHIISQDYEVNKIIAYNFNDTERGLGKIQDEPNVIALHSLTNELKNETPSTCVDRMAKICQDIRTRFKNTKIVLSLPTPRNDSDDYNSNGQLITILLKSKYREDNSIILCDNSNMSYKGQVLNRFIEPDGFHLSTDGIAILASNIRDCIDNALDLPPRTYSRYGSGNRGRPYRGRGGMHRGGRGGRGSYGRGRRH